jgi:hypothetical protein
MRPAHYRHSPRWFSKAKTRLRRATVLPGSERWRRLKTERAYQRKVSGPPVRPEETIGWINEEYRILHIVHRNNGLCSYWEAVNTVASQDQEYRYKQAQNRYSAVRQRLISEGHLRRFSRFGRGLLDLTWSGEQRLVELTTGVKPEVWQIPGQEEWKRAHSPYTPSCGLDFGPPGESYHGQEC